MDKSSRLLPYEDAIQGLESVYEALISDDEIAKHQKIILASKITELENSLQVCPSDVPLSNNRSWEFLQVF